MGDGVAPPLPRDAERARACSPSRELRITGLLGRQVRWSRDEEDGEGQTRRLPGEPMRVRPTRRRFKGTGPSSALNQEGLPVGDGGGDARTPTPPPHPEEARPLHRAQALSDGPRLCRMQDYFPGGRPRPAHLDSMR